MGSAGDKSHRFVVGVWWGWWWGKFAKTDLKHLTSCGLKEQFYQQLQPMDTLEQNTRQDVKHTIVSCGFVSPSGSAKNLHHLLLRQCYVLGVKPSRGYLWPRQIFLWLMMNLSMWTPKHNSTSALWFLVSPIDKSPMTFSVGLYKSTPYPEGDTHRPPGLSLLRQVKRKLFTCGTVPNVKIKRNATLALFLFNTKCKSGNTIQESLYR